MIQPDDAWRAIRTADVVLWPKRVADAIRAVAPTLGDLADMTDQDLRGRPNIGGQGLRAAVAVLRLAMEGQPVVATVRTLGDLARAQEPAA